MLADARVLLTGATGRLGRCLAQELVLTGCELVLLVRATSPEAALDRVRAALGGSVDLRRVTVLCGDLTHAELGLRMRDRRRLRASVDFVLHAAATTSFTSPLEKARATNVAATQNLLAFVERTSRLSRIGHVSTAFVAGKRTGRILESELEHDRGLQKT